MKKELNTNNSKKIIMGISILFCAVILIIGITTAYFTQSGIGDTGNIVTSNLNGTIGFTNNNDYMRYNLIPVKEGDVSLFATKNSVNATGKYTNEEICHYQDDIYACSLYEFTITNNADVTQDMKVTLTPYPNGFTNLHYLVYESKQLELNINSKVVKTATHIEKENASIMIESVTLKPKESKTYTVVFYIKAMNYDQTGEDANKRFGAIVRVDSITTGAYKNILVGNTCYEFDELNDETLMLTKFNGIDVNGNVDAGCGVTKSEDGFYSIIVPSTIGDTRVSALGNTLFMGVDLSTFQTNNFSKIDNIVVEEGITNIESGEMVGTFAGVGATSLTIDESFQTFDATYYNRKISITLPSTLTNIGDYTFALSGINDYRFNLDENNNSSIEKIGKFAFYQSNISNITLPEGIKTIDAYAFQFSNLSNIALTSNLEIIGDYAFQYCNLITDKNNPLIIPYSVNYIGEYAFYNNFNLTKLEFAGSHTDVYDNLEDERYNLLTIGKDAFYGDGLDYSGNEEFILPARVSSIGEFAFQGNLGDSIRNTLKNIRYMGFRDRLNSLGTSWYHSGVSVKAYGE